MRRLDKTRQPNPNKHHAERRTKLTGNHRCFVCDMRAKGDENSFYWKWWSTWECSYRKKVGLPQVPWGGQESHDVP